MNLLHKMDGIQIYVILLNWNGRKDTIECLESLFHTKDSRFTVIVCDNDSKDGSMLQLCQWASTQFDPDDWMQLTRIEVESVVCPVSAKSLILIQNGANLGFAGGNNPGIRMAMNDPECRYIWLLNNDTAVLPSSLPEAIARMEQDPSIGICGSTLIYFHDRNLVQAFGGAVYSRIKGSSRHIGAFASVIDIPVDPQEVEQKMTYVVGASMLVRREFIEQVGYMQEDYFLYCEEIDWATRGQGRFRLGYAPKSIVFHKEGASIGTSASGGSSLSLFFLFRNRVRFAWRFNSLYIPGVLFFCALDIMKLLVRRRWSQAVAAIRGTLQLSGPRPVINAQWAMVQR
jgi:GT2 family glycosyltransferase